MGFSIEGLRKYAEGDGGAVGLGFSGSQARTTTTFVTGGVEEKSKEDATFRDKPQPGQPGQPLVLPICVFGRKVVRSRILGA